MKKIKSYYFLYTFILKKLLKKRATPGLDHPGSTYNRAAYNQPMAFTTFSMISRSALAEILSGESSIK